MRAQTEGVGGGAVDEDEVGGGTEGVDGAAAEARSGGQLKR